MYLFGHPRATWAFTKLKGLEYFFRYNLKFYESQYEFFWYLSPLHFRIRNFRFPFSTKNSLTWALKSEKLNLENRSEFIKASKIVREWNCHPEIFSLPQAIEILGNSCFSEKAVVGGSCLQVSVISKGRKVTSWRIWKGMKNYHLSTLEVLWLKN